MARYAENTMSLHPAYVAGMVDGEGCIFIERHWDRTRKRVRPYLSHALRVCVVNNHRDVLARLHAQYGGNLRQRKSGTWAWYIDKAAAERLLVEILPFLIIKREQAELALEFRKTFPSYRPKAGINDALIAVREDFKIRLSTINQRRGRVA